MILCNHCAGRVDADSLVCTECGEAVLKQQPAPTGASIAAGPATTPLDRTSAPVAASSPVVASARETAHVQARGAASNTVAEAGGAGRGKEGGRKGAAVAVTLAVCAVLVVIIGAAVSSQRQRERELRAEQEAKAEREPFTIERVEVLNATADKEPLSGPQTSFSRYEVRFIQFHLTLRNNAYGIKDIDGQLEVNYIDPSGNVDKSSKSPGSYTLSKPLQVPSYQQTAEVIYGWGNPTKGTFAPGRWRIEFWWKGQYIGSTAFSVY